MESENAIALFYHLIYVPLCFYHYNREIANNVFYLQALEEEEKMTPEQLAIKNVGKLDPKRHLEEKVSQSEMAIWFISF
jgi:hypothetical protein